MKRLLACLLCLLMITGAACAIEEPLLRNPYEAPGYAIGELDEDVTAQLYSMLDDNCCEQDIINEYGCLTVWSQYYEDGKESRLEYCTLLPSPAGRMVILGSRNPEFEVYAVDGRTFSRTDGAISETSPIIEPEAVDHLWENHVFPFAGFGTFVGMRLTDDEMYLLMESTEGILYEYVLYMYADSCEMAEIRRYMPDPEQQAYVFDLRVNFVYGGTEIPDELLKLL